MIALVHGRSLLDSRGTHGYEVGVSSKGMVGQKCANSQSPIIGCPGSINHVNDKVATSTILCDR